MAQGIKKFVAREVKRGTSLKSLVLNIREDEECNWLDVVSTFFWWVWWKAGWPVVRWALIILGILLWVICCSIIAAVVTACVALVVLVSSPVWMPFCLWKSPEKVAKLLLDTDFEDLDDPKDTPFVISENVWKSCVRVLNLMWRPVYSLLPMNRRKFFINEDSKALKTYPVEVQVAYYDVQKNKLNTINHMSKEAMRQVWNRGEVSDRGNILKVWMMKLEDFQLLFNGGCAEFNLLKSYCTDEKVFPKLQFYFVEQLEKGEAENISEEMPLEIVGLNEAQARAFELLRICCANSLDTQTLLMLTALLGSKVGEKASDVLELYWSKNSLKNEVVKALVERATDTFVDDGKARANELLMKVVRRDGISTANAEFFFANCDSKQEKEMTSLIKLRVDMDKVGKGYNCDENRQEWLAYCKIRENFAPEAQERMKEWQYDIFRETNHKLDEEVIYTLLVKRISEDEVSFFEKVLKEAEKRDCLSETAQKLMVMTPWKREILLAHLAEHEKEKGYFTL